MAFSAPWLPLRHEARQVEKLLVLGPGFLWSSSTPPPRRRMRAASGPCHPRETREGPWLAAPYLRAIREVGVASPLVLPRCTLRRRLGSHSGLSLLHWCHCSGSPMPGAVCLLVRDRID